MNILPHHFSPFATHHFLNMGQAASKATAAVKQAAAATASRTSHPSTTIQQRTRAAAEAEWKRSSAAPSSQQQVFVEDDTTSPPETTMQEMPPDLIKFLNDAGPLQRTIDKDLTSPKVYEALLKDDDEKAALNEQAKQANTRVRRKMPIISAIQNDSNGDVNDGTMVERTTNFSTTDRSTRLQLDSKNYRLSITREDLFDISEKLNGIKVDTPQWKEIIEEQYDAIANNNNNNDNNNIVSDNGKEKTFDQLKDITLFENSMKHIGIPIIMKDNEGDIIGVWSSTVEDVKHSSGLKVLPERSVEFIMKQESSSNEL